MHIHLYQHTTMSTDVNTCVQCTHACMALLHAHAQVMYPCDIVMLVCFFLFWNRNTVIDHFKFFGNPDGWNVYSPTKTCKLAQLHCLQSVQLWPPSMLYAIVASMQWWPHLENLHRMALATCFTSFGVFAYKNRLHDSLDSERHHYFFIFQMVDYGMICCSILIHYLIVSVSLCCCCLPALLCHVVPHAPRVFISDEGRSCRRLSVDSDGGQSADIEDVPASETESHPTPDLISWNGLSEKRSDETLVNWFNTDNSEATATQSVGDSQGSVCKKDSVECDRESDALSSSKDVSDLFTLCDDDNRSIGGTSEPGGRFETNVCQQQSQGDTA